MPIRPTSQEKLRYVIGDAFAEGFGAGTQYPDLVFEGRDGLWRTDFAKGGSNLREAQNLANHLLADIVAGKHDGCEVWCFTDNAVWSYVWTKGFSTARHLFMLVLELRIAARKHEVYLRTCYILGKRMCQHGKKLLVRFCNLGLKVGWARTTRHRWTLWAGLRRDIYLVSISCPHLQRLH